VLQDRDIVTTTTHLMAIYPVPEKKHSVSHTLSLWLYTTF